MKILRIETKNVLSLPDGAIDFPEHAVVVGSNDSGKSCLYRTLCCMLGWSSESLAALVRRDESGQPTNDTPACTIILEGDDGQRYRLTRRAGDIKTEREVEGAWVKCPGSSAAALASIVEPKAAPDALLAGNLSDAGRIKLLLDVVPAVKYVRAELLAQTGVDVEIPATPAGGHVLDFLDVVERALADNRLGVGKAKAAAEGVVAKLAAGLPAATPEDPRSELARVEVEAREMGERVKTAEQARDHAYATAVTAAKNACDQKTQKLTADFEKWIEQKRAELERRIAQARAEMETAVDAAEACRDKAVAEAERVRTDEHRTLADATATLTRMREYVASMKAEAATWERDAGLRAEVEKNRADARRHEERYVELSRQIQAVRALAAGYVGAALPGVRVQADEDDEGKVGKPYIQVETKAGWQAWSDANEATRRQVALRWSELRQAQGATQGEGLRILDEGETLDPDTRARWFGRPGQTIMFCVGDGPLSVKEASRG